MFKIMKRRVLSGMLIMSVLMTMGSCSGCLSGILGLDEGTRDVLESAINELSRQPGRWEDTMTNAIDRLGTVGTRSARKVLREVEAVYTRALGQTESAAFCAADFIGIRVKQRLQEILRKFDKDAPPPSIVPVVCLTDPQEIKADETRLVKFYGLDFLDYGKTQAFNVDLRYASGQVVQPDFGHLSVTTNYLLQLDVQGADYGALDPSQGPQVVLKWGDEAVPLESGYSELPVILPGSEHLCEIKRVVDEPDPIEYVPPHVGGDREFAGHGPSVYVGTQVAPTASGRYMYADVEMDAKETEGDRTHARGSERRSVYEPPDGWRIWRLVGNDFDYASYVDEDCNDDILDPFYDDGPVRRFVVVGDTSGEEAGIDTQVTVHFNTLEIELIEEGACEPPPAARVTVRFDKITTHVGGQLIYLNFDVSDHSRRWPQRGAEPAVPGNACTIGERFELLLGEGESLEIVVTGWWYVIPGWFPLSSMIVEHADTQEWGQGSHSAFSASADYTLDYTIEVDWLD